MVGLVVTPTTLRSSTSDCRFPLRMRSRERSSSQTATPADDSSASFSFCAMSGPPGEVLERPPFRVPRRACEAWGKGWSLQVAGRVGQAPGGCNRAGGDGVPRAGGLDRLAGSGHDGLVGEPELLVQHRVGRAGAVVGEAHDPAGVTDELAPAHGHARLDAHPGPEDRKSTRLNSSHANISYAVFCLKKKKQHDRNFIP